MLCRTLMLAACLAFAACGSNPTDSFTIAAAASLRPVLEQLFRDAATPPNVVYGASGQLATQILQNAPFDVFLSADEPHTERVLAQGGSSRADAVVFALGRLALWLPEDSPLPFEGLGVLRDPRVKHIAIANPAHAPYGEAAIAAMEQAGVLGDVRDRLVLGENVAQAAAFATSGAADAALIALSLAKTPPLDKGKVLVVPAGAHKPLKQTLVVCRDRGHRDAAHALRDLLRSERARTILQQLGFDLPDQ
jgi:molybdate transport system substrate-binding protein